MKSLKFPKGFNTLDPPLFFHQWESFIYGIEHEQAGILLDLGLGKTRVGIEIARYRIQNNNVKKVVVICPSSILLNWQRQINLYSEYKANVLHSPLKEKRLAKFKKRNFEFFIINYDALRIYLSELHKLQPHMLILDESARFLKNPDTLRTLASISLADKVRYKLILTGRLISKPTDVWPQFRVLDWGRTFGRNFEVFRNTYLFNKRTAGNPHGKWVLKTGSDKAIQARIYQSCIRRKKEECLDLPKQIFMTIEVPLGSLKDTYKSVEKRVLSEIDTLSGPIQLRVNNALVKLQKLQQITAGILKTKEGEARLEATPKLDALKEILWEITDANESVVIWCKFHLSIQIIEELLKKEGIQYLTMSGKDSAANKDKKWTAFQANPNISVFVGQITSGGIGIELFKIESSDEYQHMLFFENTTCDDREQAMGRIHRPGQLSMCRYIDLVVKDTYDERIIESIKRNKDIADSIQEVGVRRFLREGIA